MSNQYWVVGDSHVEADTSYTYTIQDIPHGDHIKFLSKIN